MAVLNPYQSYQQNSVQTASAERLTLMLFDGAIRFMNLAKGFINKNELEQTHHNLVKAQAIFSELIATLDMNYQISHQLRPLYEFCHRRLLDANLQKSAGPIDEVLGLTSDLRDTWEQAMRIAKSGQALPQ